MRIHFGNLPQELEAGVMRLQELRRCDDYANDYGIEMIPCIQTYSHMEQYFLLCAFP